MLLASLLFFSPVNPPSPVGPIFLAFPRVWERVLSGPNSFPFNLFTVPLLYDLSALVLSPQLSLYLGVNRHRELDLPPLPPLPQF